MKSLEKMNERLLIQDKITTSNPQSTATSVSTINAANYIGHLQDHHQQSDTPTPHKIVQEMKKNTPSVILPPQYHELVRQIYAILDQMAASQDFRLLK